MNYFSWTLPVERSRSLTGVGGAACVNLRGASSSALPVLVRDEKTTYKLQYRHIVGCGGNMDLPLIETLRRKTITLLTIFLLLVLLGWNWSLGAVEAESLLTPAELIAALREGGMVLYMRHAATDHSQLDQSRNRAMLQDCRMQRNLSAEGRQQAERIGQAIRALGIRIDEVFSSPYCRCRDTAQLAFGDHHVMQALHFAIGMRQSEKAQMSEILRRQLGQAPRSGSNRVLVSHTANLKEATGLWPMLEGVVMVFRPQQGQSYQFLGQINPDDWPE
jgi:phosphohistidine phosphatase SixA